MTTATLLLALTDVAPWLTLAIAFLGVGAVAVKEERTNWPEGPTPIVDREPTGGCRSLEVLEE
jgi:hypothetical protein